MLHTFGWNAYGQLGLGKADKCIATPTRVEVMNAAWDGMMTCVEVMNAAWDGMRRLYCTVHTASYG